MYLKKQNFIIETLLTALIIGALSLLPLLEKSVSTALLIIVALAQFLSFWHGRRAGYIFLLIALSINLGYGYLARHSTPSPLGLFNTLALSGVLIYLGGTLKSFRQHQLEKVMVRYRKGSEKRSLLNRISRAQQDIIKELEERVTRLKTSPSIMFDQIRDIDCLDSSQSLSRLLHSIAHFTEAEALSLWVYDKGDNCLKLKMQWGDEKREGRKESLGLKDSIEGWVFRNNKLFTMRMILDYENLEKLNSEHCIVSCPVVVDNQTWGVISIDSLPFIKYSEYTENIAQIIISLAQPALKKALDFEALLLGEEHNEDTGLPQFTQLYRILDQQRFDETAGFNSCSLILFEFMSFERLREEIGRERTLSLQAELMKEIADSSGTSAEIFHYREEERMALFIPYLDYDGCSLFCLETLEMINNKKWTIKEESIAPEVNLGYASSGTSEKMDPDDLIKRAEYLLEIQKI